MGMSKETQSRLIVILILTGCLGAAILLGVVIFALPWKSTDDVVIDGHSSSQGWTVAEVESDPKVLSELKSIENSSTLSYIEKAQKLLSIYPVFDGHNDLPWNIRKILGNKLENFNFTSNLSLVEPWNEYNNETRSHTDIPRLMEGHVGAQFWVAYAECSSQGKDAVVQTLEQIDVIQRLVEEYPDKMELCTTANCVMETSFNKKGSGGGGGKIASLIGVEGGHSIQYSVGALRQMYNLGVRYLTLTHGCNTPWADASPVDKEAGKGGVLKKVNEGLSWWGLELIDEMNRIGMMVDLSHVSEATMMAALRRSKAPVIFSHSGVKAVCDVHRNVGDEALKLLKSNGGVIMINFYSEFVSCGNPARMATLEDVISHIEHVRDVIGVEHIGIGGDYDGVDETPEGLEDVSKYPKLFGRMIEKGWDLRDLRKISFTNVLRVMEDVERVKKELSSGKQKMLPMESIILEEELKEKGFYGEGDCLSKKSLSKFSNN